jgi:hypothetical protein
MMKGTKLVAAGIGILIMVIAVPIVASAQGMMGPQIRTTGPVTMDQAINLVQQALARLGNSDLVPMEIMEFSNNFYVVVAEKSTGIGAFELIVERTRSLGDPSRNIR